MKHYSLITAYHETIPDGDVGVSIVVTMRGERSALHMTTRVWQKYLAQARGSELDAIRLYEADLDGPEVEEKESAYWPDDSAILHNPPDDDFPA